MKKLLLFFAALGFMFMTACSSSPEAKIEKLQQKSQEFQELVKEKGLEAPECVELAKEIATLEAELAKEAKENNWTPEQLKALGSVSNVEDLQKAGQAVVDQATDKANDIIDNATPEEEEE